MIATELGRLCKKSGQCSYNRDQNLSWVEFPAVLTFSVCCVLFIANSQWDMIGPRDPAVWNSPSDDAPTLSTSWQFQTSA